MLLILLSETAQSVARVRLSSNQYTVLEGEQQWCIEVINDEYGPDTTDFTVTYSYSEFHTLLQNTCMHDDHRLQVLY